MINTQKNTRSKKIIVTAVIAIACCLAGVGAMALTHTGPFNNSNPASTNQSQNDTSTTPATPGNSPAKGTETPGKTPASNEPTESTTPGDQVAASITAANQNGNLLQIRTLIESVSSNGTCKLTASKDGVSRTYNVGTQAQSSSSTCKGFDIPVSDLSVGAWKIDINISVDGKTAHLIKNITIN